MLITSSEDQCPLSPLYLFQNVGGSGSLIISKDADQQISIRIHPGAVIRIRHRTMVSWQVHSDREGQEAQSGSMAGWMGSHVRLSTHFSAAHL